MIFVNSYLGMYYRFRHQGVHSIAKHFCVLFHLLCFELVPSVGYLWQRLIGHPSIGDGYVIKELGHKCQLGMAMCIFPWEAKDYSS